MFLQGEIAIKLLIHNMSTGLGLIVSDITRRLPNDSQNDGNASPCIWRIRRAFAGHLSGIFVQLFLYRCFGRFFHEQCLPRWL